ncbi:MAG TPA: hypothetical protein VHI10_00145, partial [Mycobacterium sp.]|nr:hypothetical protein [Mycobacterium sp.]
MGVGSLLRTSAALPLRTAAFGVKTATTVAGFSVDVAAAAAGKAASAGVDAALTGLGMMSGGVGLVTAPLREVADVPSAVESIVRIALDNAGGPPVRRCCQRPDRAWIEVRGLREEHGEELGKAVLEALRAHPGVSAAHLNFPLSRVFVRVSEGGPSCGELCEVIGDAEEQARAQGVAARPSRAPFLPGDDTLLLSRLVSAGVAAAGLWGAAAGRTLR